MTTLQHVLAALRRMDVEPSEILITQNVYVDIIRQARHILRGEGEQDELTEPIDGEFLE